jgi:hypothetical protein
MSNPLKYYYVTIYSNIKANIYEFDLLNADFQCCIIVGRKQHKRAWSPLKNNMNNTWSITHNATERAENVLLLVIFVQENQANFLVLQYIFSRSKKF